MNNMIILKKRFGNYRISFNKARTLAGILKVCGNRFRTIASISIVDMENPYQLSLYGYAVVKFMDDKVWSLIDSDGNIIIQAPIITSDSNKLYGFNNFTILLGDGKGNYAIYDPETGNCSKYSYTRFENCGTYIKAYRGEKVGALSLNFQEIIEPTHQDIQKVAPDLFKVKDEKTSRLFRISNNCWSKPYYDFILQATYIETVKSGRGIINTQDFKEILEPIYRKVEEFGTLYKGTCQDQSEVIMAKEWEGPSEKCVKIYEEANGFIRAIVQMDYSSRNLGYIFINRKNGRRLIDKVYDSAIDSKENNRGFIWARKDNRICYVDAQGHEVQNVAKTF